MWTHIWEVQQILDLFFVYLAGFECFTNKSRLQDTPLIQCCSQAPSPRAYTSTQCHSCDECSQAFPFCLFVLFCLFSCSSASFHCASAIDQWGEVLKQQYMYYNPPYMGVGRRNTCLPLAPTDEVGDSWKGTRG